jgi:hypothetical protein
MINGHQPFIETASAPPSESRLSFNFQFSFDLIILSQVTSRPV